MPASAWVKEALIEQDRPVPLIRWTHGLVNRVVMATDAAFIIAAAQMVRLPVFSPAPASRQMLIMSAVCAVVFWLVLSKCSGYRVERYSRIWIPARDVLRALLPGLAIGLLPVWAFAPDMLRQPNWLVGWAGLTAGALLLDRQIIRRMLRVVDRKGLLRRRVVIVGATRTAEDLIQQMTDPSQALEYDIVGIYDDRTAERRPLMVAGIPISGTVADLIDYAQYHAVDTIVVALSWDKSLAIFRLIEQVQWISADVVVPFERDRLLPHTLQLVQVAQTPSLQLLRRPFKGSQGVVKVAEDYIVAMLALIAVSPVMLAAAIAIRMEGKGPILFRQRRLGFNGRPFMIYKFRSMVLDPTDDGSVGTGKFNPRITRVGAFLRRTSIDELPQLLNVLRGDMSIVGPRPHVPGMRVGQEVYNQAVRTYAARHRIKPGITGWAQINGMRGGIHSMAKAERGVELDLYYIKNWSIGLDLKIMLRTLIIGMVGRNVF